MTTLSALIATTSENLEKLLGYGSILFDDIFALSKSAASKAISGSEIVGLTKPAISKAVSGSDVAGLVKPAVSKATGVVVDDMTVVSSGLNESEIAQEREFAVWRKIVAGSLVNKAVVMVVVLGIGAAFPLVPQIMLGLGACYLALEGTHKVFEYVKHSKAPSAPETPLKLPKKPGIFARAMQKPAVQKALAPLAAGVNRFLGTHAKERAVLKDLLLLDAILSTEILLMAKSTLGDIPIAAQLVTLIVVSFVTTFGVYGIVFAIIRADNVAESLCNPASRFYSPRLAQSIMKTLPYALSTIGVIGTIAMLAVAGDVLAHMMPAATAALGAGQGAAAIERGIHAYNEAFVHTLPFGGATLSASLLGLVLGLILIRALSASQNLAKKWRKAA